MSCVGHARGSLSSNYAKHGSNSFLKAAFVSAVVSNPSLRGPGQERIC